MSSLRKLFREYLDEDDSFEGVELTAKKPVVVVPAPVVTPPPAQETVTAVTGEVIEVEVEHPDGKVNPGFMQPWFSRRLAKKSMGPQLIRITFVELFYDLIYAAVLSGFAFNIAFGWPGGKWLNFVQMIMLLALWHDNVVFTNMVFSQEGLSYFLLFLHFLGVLGMVFFRNIVVNGGGDVLLGFVVSFLWARFFQIVLYVCVVFSKDAAKQSKVCAAAYALLIALTCIPVAATLGIAGSVDVYGRVMIWLVGIGIDHLARLLLPLVPAWRTALPVAELAHLRDRFGAFLVFLFGYILIATFFDEAGPFTSGEWGSIVLIWLIAFSFVWMYYGDRADDERAGFLHPLKRERTWISQLWQFLHLPLAMAIVIMADAGAQIIYYYRGIVRPGTVEPILTPSGPGLRLANSVQWIYGLSFAIALGLIAIIAFLYKFDSRRHSKRKLERTIGRAILVLVMILIPLGGLDHPMEPIIQLIVGAIVLFALVIFDWACHVALGPLNPAGPHSRTVRVPVPAVAVSSGDGEALRARLAAQDQELSALRKQLAATAAVTGGEADRAAGGGSEDLSSSKDWGFSSRTSSVVEDVVVSEDATESNMSEDGVSPNPQTGAVASSNEQSSEQPVPDDQQESSEPDADDK